MIADDDNEINNAIPLSKNAFKELFKLEVAEKNRVFTIDYRLQVIKIQKNETQPNSNGKSVYQASLSDGDFKFQMFLIFREENDPLIEEGDVIDIFKVSPAHLTTQKTKLFIIKKYNIIQKNLAVIGKPEILKENEMETAPENLVKVESTNVSGTNLPLGDKNQNSANLNGIKNSVKNSNGSYINNSNENNSKNSKMTNFSENSQKQNSNFSQGMDIVESTIFNQNSQNSHSQNSSKNQMQTSQISTNSKINNFPTPFNISQKNHQDKIYSFQPLMSLTTFSKDIHILVRVLKKTTVRSFNSGPYPGSLFSFNVIDSDNSELQITCFNKACEKFFDLIKENSVYEIHGGYIKMSDKKYSNARSEYTMIIYEQARVIEREDDGSIKAIIFNYVKINEIANLPANTIIDILGYVLEAADKFIKHTKKGQQGIRKLVIGDESGFKIEFTMWNEFSDLSIKVGDIVSVKAVKIGDYNGRSLSSVDHSSFIINPAGYEALKNFCDNFKEEWRTFNEVIGTAIGDTTYNNNVNTQIYTIKQVLGLLDNGLSDDKLPVVKLKAVICTIVHQEKNFYPGCPDKTCKKKLFRVSEDSDEWVCNLCKKQTDKPFYYYRFQVRIKDYSGEHWIDIFGDFGNKLFGITCEEYKDLVYTRDEDRLFALSNALEFKTFFFIVKPKMNTYNSQNKKKFNCYKIEPSDQGEEARRIVKNLSLVLNVNTHLNVIVKE